MYQLRQSLYGAEGIIDVLQSGLGKDTTLGNGIAANTSLVVPAYDLKFRRPLAFFSLAPNAGPLGPGMRLAGVAKLAATATQVAGPEHAAERFNLQWSTSLSGGGAAEVPEAHRSRQLCYRASSVYSENADFLLREVVRASSAAPTFLPAATVSVLHTDGGVGDELWCIDGGVAANNPSMIALTFCKAVGHDPSNTAILSLGTGEPHHLKVVLRWHGALTRHDCDRVHTSLPFEAGCAVHVSQMSTMQGTHWLPQVSLTTLV